MLLPRLFALGIVFMQLAITNTETEAVLEASCDPPNGLTTTGMRLMFQIIKNCKNPDFQTNTCFNACRFQRLDILTFDDPTTEVMHHMQSKSKMLSSIISDEKMRSQISSKIIAECSEKLKEANEKKIPCDDRLEFYRCVGNAWKC